MGKDDRLAERTTDTTATGPGEPTGGASRVGGGRTGVGRTTALLVAAGLVLTALNLRPAVAGLGPLLAEVRTGLGMSGTVAGLLTSAPALCFALFGGLAPRLARRFGPTTVVAGAVLVLALGLLLRPLAGSTAVFLGTSALALGGIAVGNVLMPVLVKRWFPDRVGTMTGLYSMALALGTAAAAALTVPVVRALDADWRFGLGMWAGLALLALLPWTAVLLRHRATERARASATGTAPSGERVGSGPPIGQTPAAELRITRSRTAWALGLFFGLQATGAYVVLGWLPQILRDAGVPATTAGVLLAVTMGMGVPLSFVLPRLAARLGHQGPLVAALGVSGLAGYLGLLLAPAAGAWAWALLLGVANCAFPLVLTMIGMRARTHAGVIKLSGFVQGTGYLLSVPGPLLVGVLHDAFGGWRAPLLMMAALVVVQMGVGVVAGRDRCVEDDVPVRH
ncbi:MFS transporter [Streptomyces alkaliterrae]|uniref:MFS transporter n=1 Tax=Streptomyces alkaliterrae TaxID=2213162 RepID=A0A5P0YPJ1_9ACTN|nr:MFS transporter [Streptomyces alkaliterrae]MBB1260812.1 MFS transporter [Streptomyces alkaliterrae]MQS00439.1 MFS transporter [Streptomyces alkaliterrae]